MDWNSKSIARILLGITTVACMFYAIYGGLSAKVPYQNPMNEQTARNFFFHVPLWFAGMLMGYTSVVYSILFLRKQNLKWDILAHDRVRQRARPGIRAPVARALLCRAGGQGPRCVDGTRDPRAAPTSPSTVVAVGPRAALVLGAGLCGASQR